MLCTTLLLTVPALIQGGPGNPHPEPPGMKPGPARDRVMARISQIRAERLQQSLGLPEDKAKAIAARWQQLDLDGMDYRQRMRQIRQRVNDTLMGPGSEEDKNAKLRPMLEEHTNLRARQHNSRQKFEDEIRASLTPAQQGRLILLMEDLQHTIQEALRGQRGQGPGQELGPPVP